MHTPFRLNIGHLSTIYHTSFILMGTDSLDKAGIQANWKLFASGPDMVRAFSTGDIDIGYIGLPPAIIGIDRGVPIICVGGGHVEGTVLVAGKEYLRCENLSDANKVLSQFEGKVIGSPPRGSIHDVIIHDALDKAKVSAAVKNFSWTDFVLEALVDGNIDAAVGTPSLAVASARACGARIIIPPHAFWPDNPSYGIVVRNDLRKFPGMITDFLREHEKAGNFIKSDPQCAARIASKVMGLVDEDFVLEAYRISPKYCAALSSEFISSTMAFVPVLRRLGYITQNLKEKEIFDFSFIREAHKEQPHYNL
ncbi:MAG: ABC transporter substrate-binding protein [Candidatus Methanoperedens sp.]|nr:ABC transporter substrate-binding protein [Candidatus Methanoperedens sp.]